MRLLPITFLMALGLLTSITASSQSWFGWGKGISGKGPLVERSIDLPVVNGIVMSISGELILTQDDSQDIRVEGQENILDLLKTEVKNGIWKIGFEENVNNHKTIKIYASIKTLTKLKLTGSGHVRSTNTFRDLNEISIRLTGSGNLNFNFEADRMEASVSGSGSMVLSGSTNSQETKITGSGSVKAQKLHSHHAKVNITGSGSAKVYVEEALDCKITGSGNIHYKGSPHTNSRIVGSGNIKQI